MRLFQNPLIGLLIMASIIIMAFTVLFLWVQGRPDVPADGIVQTDASLQVQDQIAIETAVPFDPGLFTESALVEGEVIILQPNPNERVQRLDSIQPRPFEQDPLSTGEQGEIVVVQVDPNTQTEQPAVQPEAQVVDPQPTPVVVIIGDGGEGATPIPQQVVTAVDPFIFQAHIVAAGDTLYNIARRYNTAVELMAEKGISSANLIVGSQINVPVPNPNYCPGLEKYVVREGDTVFRISTNYNRTVEQIRVANNLDAASMIKIGQVLCLP